MYLTIIILGFMVTHVHSQELTTKCFSPDWTKYYEKCYLAVNYTLSWSGAKDYCGKYGARLVEPRGYELNDAINSEVVLKMPSTVHYWTGYTRIPPSVGSVLSAYSGNWSNGEPTGVEVGVWGLNQPDVSAGDCAFVNNGDKLWHMGSCDMLMPFLCEMDPCPTGSRDTFMCNGKCLGLGLVCNGINDCGNNLDEQNCASIPAANTCSKTLQASSGTLTLDTPNGFYSAYAHCTWQIETKPGTRINMMIKYIRTEDDTDFVEIFDGGFGLSDSSLALRLSGSLDNYPYRSSLNFAFVRFTSDGSTEDSGFEITWTTAYECEYTELMGYTFSNQDIQYERLPLTSAQTFRKCQFECDDVLECVGFSYNSTGKICQFMNMLPILEQNSMFSIYSKTCPGYGSVQGSVPLWSSMLTASYVYKQIASPFFPNPYLGNTELEYHIRAPANFRITLEVLTVDLCCGDTVTILDHNRVVLYELNSDSVPLVLISTSNTLLVRMDLKTHWKCNGVLMKYIQGCDVTMMGSGQFMSPGYGIAVGYGPLTKCTWTLNAPSTDRSVSVVFEDFNLHYSDSVMLTYINGTRTVHTNQTLNVQSFTATNMLQVTMETSSTDSGPGFTASYSPGCASLQRPGYVLSSGSNNYGDTITMECASGFYFTGQYAGQSSLTLTCGLGGSWSMYPVPVCERANCGAPPLITNGYIKTSNGSQGGDMTEYECKDGYQMAGNTSIRCQEDGFWEAEPQCTAAMCEDLNTLTPKMESTVLYGINTEYDSVVRLSCPMYTEVIGAATVSCRDGEWDFSADTKPSLCRAIPCETPIIEKALLAPSPPYTINETITVTCMEGYNISGNSTFRCGVDTVFPSCVPKTCTLEGLSDIDTVGRTLFNYGENVTLTCKSGLRLVGVQATSLTTECLASGEWSHVPVCTNKSCGEPYQVPGSEYILKTCLDYECFFEFICKPGYVRHGKSDFLVAPSQNDTDNIVRCGAIMAGLWDFGDLRCIGGQCADPGYPPSGRLVGESFEEGAVVTFECYTAGYEPIVNGQVSTGMQCVRNPSTGLFYWEGVMPSCVDTQAPVFEDCPSESIEIDYLESPGFTPPTPTDNNAIKTLNVYPTAFDPALAIASAAVVNYIAEDYNGNVKRCTITIRIPDYFVCMNDYTTNLELIGDAIFYGNDSNYFELKLRDTEGILITFEPSFIYVNANGASLENIYEIDVRATNAVTGATLDSCTLQFQFTAPNCASWSLYVPNGVANCINGVCDVTCNNGFYFIDNPQLANTFVTCTQTGWDSFPVCSHSTTNFVSYLAKYNFRYHITTGLNDFAVCESTYTSEVRDKLITFAVEMQELCNSLNPSTFSVTFVQPLSLTYNTGTLRLDVNFEFRIDLVDESATNGFELKDTCSNYIYSSLASANVNENNYAVNRLSGNSNCDGGVYEDPTSAPSFEYSCFGNRQYKFINGNRSCLDCPIGYNFNGENCTKCPRGKYGNQDDVMGAVCIPCPNGNGPDKTGLTDVSQCSMKGKCSPGYYSTDGLEPCTMCPKNFYSSISMSITCQQCDRNLTTLNQGTTDESGCLSQEQAEQFVDQVTPCKPNPCLNGAVCTYEYNTYYCNCATGFTGQLCNTHYSACSSIPCENGQQCIDEADGNFTCFCGASSNNEFSGERCEIDDLGCAPNFCKNNGTCHNARGSYDCKCTSYGGFTSDSCETEINQCMPDTCVEGTCIAHGSFYRSCSCYPGFTGLNCSTNIDDCVQNQCQNGGTCMDGINSFTCKCLESYHGGYCQFMKSCNTACGEGVDSNCNTCDPNGTDNCINIGNSFACTCNGNHTGTSCEIPLSPCNSYPCQHNGTCIQLPDNRFTCNCSGSWTGDLCDTDIDNCPVDNGCLNEGKCYSSSSRFVCSCPSSYIGGNCSVEYDLCDRANPCASPNSTCSFKNTGFTCNCEQGYTGSSCETKTQSCDDLVCNNGGICLNTEDGAKCSCADGYTGLSCDTNIDECANGPCPTDRECQDGVNSYTCTCGTGKRGANCDKDVGADFDYVIRPSSKCREEASKATFGNGVTPIDSLFISFWARYTVRHGTGSILNVYATNEDVVQIPQVPQFKVTFTSTRMKAEYTVPTARRKKRSTIEKSFNYPTNIADGYWWHIALVWTSTSGELTLYINGVLADQEFFAVGNSLGTRGFAVFGAFDTVSGVSDVANSFEGKVSQLFILREPQDIQSLFDRTLIPENQLLYPQRTFMLYNSLDYFSELRANTLKCVSRTDTSCDINAVTGVPGITSCPGDALSKTGRLTPPTWTEPIFAGNTQFISTLSSGTLVDWGLYGVTYAAFDSQNSAAVCTFRVFNRADFNCLDTFGIARCEGTDTSRRCERECGTSQGWSGEVPHYLTCSMYGMWDEPVKTSTYFLPRCSDATPITNDVTLDITADTNVSCTTIINNYIQSIKTKLNLFNSNVGNALCRGSCDQLISASTVTCLDDNTAKVSINFGLLSPTMTWRGSSVTFEEAIQIAAGDEDVFSYTSTSNTATVNSNVASIDIGSTTQCSSQYQISGDQCVLCGAGTVFDGSTSTCVRCAKGTYRDTLASTTCTACHESQTTANDGATSPTLCKLECYNGQYNDGVDCRPCQVGFYQNTQGGFTCIPCPVDYTTVGSGSLNSSACVTFTSLITTPDTLGPGPNTGASQEDDSGLGTGAIVALVLGIIIALLIIILILVFCCCKDLMPCMAKKKQIVSPIGKDSYYANKYGELNMSFVSYNLKDAREKKGRPRDKEPIYEPPLSDDTASLKTDLSIHVPVFNEKMNGRVTKKSMYISNGGQHLNTSLSRSQKSTVRELVAPQDHVTTHILAPMTSSPRSMNRYHYDNEEEVDHYRTSRSKKKKRRGHKHRSSHRHENGDEVTYDSDLDVRHQHLPKALSPLPLKVISKAPADVFMRPASPMNRPRAQVLPSQYEDFLNQSPVRSPGRSRVERSHSTSRVERSVETSRDERSHDRSRGDRSRERPRGERSHDRSTGERSLERSRGERSHHRTRSPKVDRFEDPSSQDSMMRIVVESDGDDER